jgi:hypothetical protein
MYPLLPPSLVFKHLRSCRRSSVGLRGPQSALIVLHFVLHSGCNLFAGTNRSETVAERHGAAATGAVPGCIIPASAMMTVEDDILPTRRIFAQACAQSLLNRVLILADHTQSYVSGPDRKGCPCQVAVLRDQLHKYSVRNLQ